MSEEETVAQIEATTLKEGRRKARAMRSSTFKAIAALEFGPPEEWEEGLLDEVVEDVIAVDRVRWHERSTWISVVIAVGMASFALAWMFKPEPEQLPITFECGIEYVDGVGKDVQCEGAPDE